MLSSMRIASEPWSAERHLVRLLLCEQVRRDEIYQPATKPRKPAQETRLCGPLALEVSANGSDEALQQSQRIFQCSIGRCLVLTTRHDIDWQEALIS
jgi:hypothetical protein